MPDADFPNDTRADAPAPAPAPQDWNAAFAAMPLETPPADGWTRVQAALPGRPRSTARYWVPAALAASLAMLVLWPRHPGEGDVQPHGVATVPTTSVPAHATPPDSRAPSIESVTPAVANTDATTPSTNSPAASNKVAPTTAPAERNTDTPQLARIEDAPARKPDRVRETPAPRRAEATPAPAHASQRDTAVATRTDDASLETLYAESAQLEALLSQVSDDRVASGPAMALSAELHERVGSIDVALSQPDVDATTRVALWRERVATLQRLTGVEGTQRWMAANGFRSDGAVAQIY